MATVDVTQETGKQNTGYFSRHKSNKKGKKMTVKKLLWLKDKDR